MDLCPGVTFKFACRSLVIPARFKLTTFALEKRCSIQLSYGTKINPGNVVSKKRAPYWGLVLESNQVKPIEVTNMVARNFFYNVYLGDSVCRSNFCSTRLSYSPILFYLSERLDSNQRPKVPILRSNILDSQDIFSKNCCTNIRINI